MDGLQSCHVDLGCVGIGVLSIMAFKMGLFTVLMTLTLRKPCVVIECIRSVSFKRQGSRHSTSFHLASNMPTWRILPPPT